VPVAALARRLCLGDELDSQRDADPIGDSYLLSGRRAFALDIVT
jgi:hypothetical protein